MTRGEANGWTRRLLVLVGLTLCLVWYLHRPAWSADPTALKVQGPDTTSGNPLQVQQIGTSSTNSTQTAVANSSTGANAQQVATLAGVVGKTTYISGVAFTTEGATAGVGTVCTITGVIGGPLNFTLDVGNGTAAQSGAIIITFNPPLPATAT